MYLVSSSALSLASCWTYLGHVADHMRTSSVWPDLIDDLPDLGLKTHVQHPVSLVQHQVGSPLEVHLSNLQEINEPSRYGNHYLSP